MDPRTSKPDRPDFDTAFAAFMTATQDMLNKHYADRFSGSKPPTLTAEAGRKYIRIVSNDASGFSRSVFCFVAKDDGAILMAAGWKAPARHARGSIYVNHGQDALTPYGAKYLNGFKTAA